MRRTAVVGAAVAALVGACGAGAAQAAPVEAYGALPSVDQPALSPDGSKLAYILPDQAGRQGVQVVALDTGSVVVGMPGTEQKVRNLVWADPQHLIVMKSQTGQAFGVESARGEWTMAQVVDIAKRKGAPLLNAEVSSGTERARIKSGTPMIMNIIAGEPQPRTVGGQTLIYVRGVAFRDRMGVPTLFAVDLARHSQDRIDSGLTGQDRDWIVDAAGKPVAQVTYDQVRQEWSLRTRRGEAWADAYTAKAVVDTPSVEGMTPDGAALILRTPSTSGYDFRKVSLSDGSLAPAPDQFKGFSDVVEDPATHRIIGGVKGGLDVEYVFFDQADQAAWNGIQALFPGEEVELASWSNDRRKVLVKVTGQVHGVAYVLVDLAAHKASVIADAYQGIKAQDIAAVETIAYKAADGRTIPAYLTLPNGKDAKNLPLVVLPHGGPASRDAGGFDWWAQALASRGYAVLQPQFRGSDGLGWDLLSAGFHEWGRKMQTDLSDGVAALAHAGVVDAKRVCIVGGSYGGYAAMAGVTLQSGIYRCAVSVAGVSDLRRQLGGRWADPVRDVGVRYMDRFMDAKDPDDPALDKISPVHFADRLSAPLLLIHGKDDTVVKIEQSRRMADALKDAGKSAELVVLENEDHWLSRSETRQQMLQATVKFLEANNPPS